MKYVDYREKLGLGFNDADKTKMIFNKIIELLKKARNDYHLQEFLFGRDDIKYLFCQMVGENTCYNDYRDIMISFDKETSIAGIISKFIVLVNLSTPEGSEFLVGLLKKYLESLNIAYELIKDEDGYFVFPKGAKELDNALVSAPLEWLSSYPKARETYIIALKQYSEGIYIRDVADNLRKALETFLQEFLGNTKNLETNKNEICKYLGEQGVDSGVSGLFQPLINAYKNINDRIAKHNDAVDKNLLEFLLYQTGVLIRMVIIIKNGGKV